METKMTFSFMTGVAVSLTTFHFHIPSLDMGTLRMQSKIPTAIVYVETAHMRVLRPLRSAQVKQMHSLIQRELKQEAMKTITGTITAMVIMVIMVTMVIMVIMVTMGIIMASDKVTATTMVITVVATMEPAMALTMDKVSKVLDPKSRTNLMVGHFKVSIILAQTTCNKKCKYTSCHSRSSKPLLGLEYQERRGVSHSTADSGLQSLTAKPLLWPADADTDAGFLLMQPVSSRSVSDTVMRRCPPPDSDMD